MGPTLRYLLSPAYRILKGRKYNGRLWYLAPEDGVGEGEGKGGEREGEGAGEREKMTSCMHPCDVCRGPLAHGAIKFCSLFRYLILPPAIPDEIAWPPFRNEDPPPDGQVAAQEGNASSPAAPSPSGLVERDVVVHGRTWRCVEGNFTMVTASLIHSISIDAKAAPYSHISDGKIDLLFSSEESSKFDTAMYFLSLSSEQQVGMEGDVVWEERLFVCCMCVYVCVRV